MIAARLLLAPPTYAPEPALLAVILALANVNAAWILAARERGLNPPCCVACCEPPWCARPIVYVERHDRQPTQTYIDGPTMFALGAGTCADIVAYNLGAMIADGKQASVVLERRGPSEWHAAIRLEDGTIKDPAAELAARTEGCGCANG